MMSFNYMQYKTTNYRSLKINKQFINLFSVTYNQQFSLGWPMLADNRLIR